MQIFLDQVTFYGNEGLEVSEEMKLSIAAQACLLIINSPAWYDTLRTVLIYPSAFRTRRTVHDAGIVHEDRNSLLGESWARGPVVLAWDHVRMGALDDKDGHNVVIHEFAHQLDNLSGHTNGIPILRKGQAYAGWETGMLQAFDQHTQQLKAGQETAIDPYGSAGHEEFFAEAIVAFFEKPEALSREHPALYRQLSLLLALDPARWD